MIITKLSDFIVNENKNNYFNLIDYTSLGILSNDDIKELCKVASKNNFYSVCVLPDYVSIVSSFLDNDDIKIVATVDFPKGNLSVSEKIKEVDKSLINGADEIDIVLNYKLIKEKEWEKVEDEIRTITEYIHKEGKISKFIIEIGALSFQELEKICDICVKSNVDYIMTSTGKLPKDISFDEKVEKVEFMRKILPDNTKIKFSGGIRTISQIEQLVQNVDRIGTSAIIIA